MSIMTDTTTGADPGGQDAARETLARRAPLVASGLFGLGLVCWIAANWEHVSRLGKLGLVGGVFAMFALATAVSRWRAAAALAALASLGGLLALVGQLYPTGADVWLLFAAWAGLGLPFALAARADAVWSVWAIVVGLALTLWRAQEAPGLDVADWGPPCALAVAVAAAFSPFPRGWTAFLGETRWAFRVAAAIAIGLVFAVGAQATLDGGGPPPWPAYAAMLALAGAFAALLRARPLEAGPASLAALACDALIVTAMWRLLGGSRHDSIPAAFLTALVAAGVAGLAVTLLRAAARRAEAAAAPRPRGFGDRAPPQATPPTAFSAHAFALAALSLLGALLALVPAVMFVALALGVRALEGGVGAAVGALCLIAGVAALRGGAAFGFRQMLGAILSLLGLALIGVVAVRHASGATRLVVFGFAALTLVAATLTPGRWPRAFFGALTMGFALTGASLPHPRLGVATAALIAATALARVAARTRATPWRPFLSGAIAAGVAAAIGEAWARQFHGAAGAMRWFAVSDAAALFAGALGVAGLLALLLRAPEGRTSTGRALALALALLLPFAPMAGLAIFVAAAMRLAGASALTTAAALAALIQFGASYYALDWSLAAKGLAFMAVGSGLGLALLALAPRRAVAAPSAPAPARYGPALALLGLAATAALVAPDVREAETAIAQGREIVLPLRPRDPRSLMQGDYMAIAFETAGLPKPDPALGATRALVRVEPTGVARFVGLANPGAAPGPDEVVVAVRARREAQGWFGAAAPRWFVGSDAFFFPEGAEAAYARARFGVLRVAPSGRAILVGLADEALRRLP